MGIFRDIVELAKEAESPAGQAVYNTEYVEFENETENAIDLSLIIAKDQDGNSVEFPEGFILGPKSTVKLYKYRKGGESDPDVLLGDCSIYWGAETLMEKGDKITFQIRDGDIIESDRI